MTYFVCSYCFFYNFQCAGNTSSFSTKFCQKTRQIGKIEVVFLVICLHQRPKLSMSANIFLLDREKSLHDPCKDFDELFAFLERKNFGQTHCFLKNSFKSSLTLQNLPLNHSVENFYQDRREGMLTPNFSLHRRVTRSQPETGTDRIHTKESGISLQNIGYFRKYYL